MQKAQESLQAAVLLDQEGYYGFAASRAYYAMFYCAEALLLTKGLAFSKHSGVIAAFGKEFAKTGLVDPKFHHFLIYGERLRNIGDYDIGPALTSEQAESNLERAKEFLDMADNYIASLPNVQTN